MHSVTALVKTFLRDAYLYNCVETLHRSYPAMPILVADDGRHSSEKEVTLAKLGAANYFRMPYSCGLSAGRNLLIDEVKTDYALIGDDDFHYTNDTNLRALLSLMEVADIAAGCVMRDGVEHHYEYDIADDGYKTRFVKMHNRYELHHEVRYARCGMTLNFFIGKTDVLRALKWDKDLRIRWEHEDFFLRANNGGVRVVYCPDAKVIHRQQKWADIREYTSHRWDDASSRKTFMARWGNRFSWPWESNFGDAKYVAQSNSR